MQQFQISIQHLSSVSSQPSLYDIMSEDERPEHHQQAIITSGKLGKIHADIINVRHNCI